MSSLEITDLPTEMHCEIGRFLSAKDLKTVSLVSWNFFNLYSWSLSKITIANLDEVFGSRPLRKCLCNVRIKADLQKLKNLQIDKTLVRNVQILSSFDVEDECTDASVDLLKIFPKMHSIFITCCKGETHFKYKSELKTLYVSEVMVTHTEYAYEMIDQLSNFQKVVIDLENDLELVEMILKNNSNSLKALHIIGTGYDEIDLSEIWPQNLDLETLILKNLIIRVRLDILKNLKTFKMTYFWNLPDVEYTYKLLPFVTHLITGSIINGSYDPINCRKLLLPKLRYLRLHIKPDYKIDNIMAPNVQRLVFNPMFVTKSQWKCLVVQFQSVSDITLFVDDFHHEIDETTSFCIENFINLKHLEIQRCFNEENLEEMIDVEEKSFGNRQIKIVSKRTCIGDIDFFRSEISC